MASEFVVITADAASDHIAALRSPSAIISDFHYITSYES